MHSAMQKSKAIYKFLLKIAKERFKMSIMPKEWEGFTGGSWTKTIDVRGFIQKNYTP